jgi:tetratricopeptide (TPR) repeat protein
MNWRLWSGVLLLVLCAASLVWIGRDIWRGQQYRRQLSEIKSAMAAKRYGVAATKLASLSPQSDEAAYLLGACELLRGRSQAAVEAWGRVAPGSEFSERAILARMRMLFDSGQIAAALEFIDRAAREPGNDPTAVRLLLVPIFRKLGRIDDAKRLVEERWNHLHETGQGATAPAIEMIYLYIDLTSAVAQTKGVRGDLDSAESEEERARRGERLIGKAEIDRLCARYDLLYARKQPIRDAIEMADLANRLGREFEARAFLVLAIANNPDRRDLAQLLRRFSH